MTTPRRDLVDPQQRLCYHIISRCVRRSYLCGRDKRTRKDYSHRKQWIIDGINHLTPCFAVNVHAYAIMSNHFHLVVEFDPKAHLTWSREQVADRWVTVCPRKNRNGDVDDIKTAIYREALLLDEKELERVRGELGDLSTYMKFLKWRISFDANREDGCTGHFFEKRFWSGAILDEPALVASMAYVDLNPVRAKIAESIEAAENTSIHERLRGMTKQSLDEAMAPLVAGLENTGGTSVSLGAYIDYLRVLTKTTPSHSDIEQRWIQQVASIGKRQRAYGTTKSLKQWFSQRRLRALESPLPG